MNLEASAKEHIKSFQCHMEAKIIAYIKGRANVNLFNPSLIKSQIHFRSGWPNATEKFKRKFIKRQRGLER